MAAQTKYFAKEYNTEKGEFELIEIPLNRDNWFYVQLDGTVRTSFFKYGFPYPKYAIIEKHTNYMIIELFREDIKDEKEQGRHKRRKRIKGLGTEAFVSCI